MENKKIYFVLESFNDQNVVRVFSTKELMLKCANRIWENFWENYADKIPNCGKDKLIEDDPAPGHHFVRTPEGEMVYRIILLAIDLDDDAKHDFIL